jgi:hypothetical protein
MPTLVSGKTHLPTVIIAEMGSDLIGEYERRAAFALQIIGRMVAAD